MSQVLEIVQLQSIDDEAAAFRAALADVERRLRGNEELNEARREFAAADSVLQAGQKDQRRVEGQVEDVTSRIEQTEKRLYSGEVKNAKELASIEHEVESLKQRRSVLEDELLEILSQVETAERTRARTAKAVNQLEALWEREQQDLKHEVKRLGDSVARADQKRELQKAKVSARSLHVYEDVRRRHGGMAVAKITGGTCGGCRVAMPESLRRRAFATDTLAQCPNCERILYIG